LLFETVSLRILFSISSLSWLDMSGIGWVSSNVIGSIWFAHLEAEDEAHNVDSLDSDGTHADNEVLSRLSAHTE
jgi:hypothetical protein